jgi:hypothetical protein
MRGQTPVSMPMDIAGQRFGKLVAVSFTVKGEKRHWLCRCDCGGERQVDLYRLRHGKATSCLNCVPRMKSRLGAETRRRQEMTRGRRMGDLTVLAPDDEKAVYFRCRCSCGKDVRVSYYELTRTDKPTTSCGCGKTNRNKARALKYEYAGVELTRAEMCEAFNLTDSVIIDRLKKGWSIDDIVTTPVRDMNRRPVAERAALRAELKTSTLSHGALARKYGVSKGLVRQLREKESS